MQLERGPTRPAGGFNSTGEDACVWDMFDARFRPECWRRLASVVDSAALLVLQGDGGTPNTTWSKGTSSVN